ncbi:MAG: hypothetical protein ACP5RT_02885 [Candidatus Micrarchaeia archaeon]
MNTFKSDNTTDKNAKFVSEIEKSVIPEIEKIIDKKLKKWQERGIIFYYISSPIGNDSAFLVIENLDPSNENSFPTVYLSSELINKTFSTKITEGKGGNESVTTFSSISTTIENSFKSAFKDNLVDGYKISWVKQRGSIVFETSFFGQDKEIEGSFSVLKIKHVKPTVPLEKVQ